MEEENSMKELTEELGIDHVSEQSNSKLKRWRFNDWFSNWIKDPYNKLFFIILILAFVIRIWIFTKTMNQPIWWDAGDYLSTAKRWGLSLDMQDNWYYRRGFFWPLFGALFFKLGLGEIGIRFSEVLFSTGIVAVTYLLIKDMFNKKLGILASLGMTFSWVLIFFTGRPLTSIPSSFFILTSVLLFWRGYMVKEKPKLIYLSGLFFILAILTRMQFLMFVPAIVLLLVLRDKFRFLKNKHIWITLGLMVIFLLPQIVLYWKHYGNPIIDILSHYFGIAVQSKSGSINERTITTLWDYFKDLPYILTKYMFIPFLIGVFYFLTEIIFGIDRIFKEKEIQKKIFILFWIIIPFLVLGYITVYVEQRYVIPTLPFLFTLAAFPFLKLEGFLSKNLKLNKKTSTILIFVLFTLLLIPNFNWGNNLMENKKTSYLEIKNAGEWMKINSNPGDIILSVSGPQITYYAERDTLGLGENESIFEEKIKEHHPRYLMLSAFEQHPEWAYNYPDTHNETLIPVQVYTSGDQPVVIIYEFKYS